MARGIAREVMEHFRRVPLFSGVSRRGLRSIVQAATEVDVPAGTVLVRQGERGREFYVIVRGTAEVTRDGKKLSQLVPGDFFGELAFLHPAPRMATGRARTDMRVVVLDARAMDVVVEREPAIARRLLAAMAERVRRAERDSVRH
jgi:CRP-like cAMP-binding protein